MLSRPLAASVLAVVCVGAAAGGAYVAVRQESSGTGPGPAVAATAPSASASDRPVQETEAVVAPSSDAYAAAAPVESAGLQAARGAASDADGSPRVRGPRTRRSRGVEAPAVDRPVRQVPSSPVPAPAPTAASAPAAVVPDTAAGPKTETPRTVPAPADYGPSDPPASSGPVYDELVVPAAAVMGLRIETPVSSERARIEDRVEARVTRDLTVDGRTAIPAGTRVVGAVTLVDRGGKVRERARLEVRFHTLVLADGSSLPVRTEAILREGDSPAGESGRKIGGAAVGGAILGAIMGGKKGAIVGGATGAAGGTAVVMTGERNAATLQPGSVVTVRLSSPLPVTVEKR